MLVSGEVLLLHQVFLAQSLEGVTVARSTQSPSHNGLAFLGLDVLCFFLGGSWFNVIESGTMMIIP